MIDSRNLTSVCHDSSNFSLANAQTVRTSLSDKVSQSRNSPLALHNLNADVSAVSVSSNADIPTPVLACENLMTCRSDFSDQADLELQWSTLKKQLSTSTLSEQETLAVLSSGILQTETGKAIANLFCDAMFRSIGPLGTLDASRRKEVVDVVCHLPPSQWQAALGENTRLASEPAAGSVASFIQSQLDRSSAQRDDRIATGEVLSDAQWESLSALTKLGRQYIRSSDGDLDGALMMLEDEAKLRGTLKDAHAQLKTFVCELEKKEVTRVRWNQHYVTAVKALCDQVKPGGSDKAGTGSTEGMFGRPSSSDPLNSSRAGTGSLPPDDGSASLLSRLQAFERNVDFYSNVSTSGLRIPKSLFGKLLFACNALDTFGALRMDSSHIATSAPTPAPVELAKEGHPVAPVDLPINQTWVASTIPSYDTLQQLATQAEQVVSRFLDNLMPWDSAYADELEEVRVILDPEKIRVVNPTIEHSAGSHPSGVEALGQQLSTWLSKMSGSLISTGAAVLSRTGDLIERYPRSALGVFATYMAISEFYAQWFLPKLPSNDPSADPTFELDFEPDEAFVVHENTVDGITELFEEQPEFAQKVLQRIAESDYLDPGDDPQLVEDFEALLKHFIPGSANVTYQDYLEEIIQLSASDAHDEFEDDADGGSARQPVSAQVADSGTHVDVRTKRSASGRFSVSAGGQTNERGVSAHAHAHARGVSAHARWLIEAGQHSSKASTSCRPDHVIAPGVTVAQAADTFIKTLEALQRVSDPSVFIQTVINQTIADSNLPENVKSTLNYKTKIKVEFRSDRTQQEDHKPLFQCRYKEFDLTQLFAGQHKKDRQWREQISIQWPDHYTSEFAAHVDEVDLEAMYKQQSQEILSQPGVFDLWKLDKQKELERTLKIYIKGKDGPAENKEIANQFLKGKIKPKTISIRDGGLSTPDKVSNAVYLSGAKGNGGLFVFLGGNSTVIEHPLELQQRTKSIEQFPALREHLSRRIALNELLARDEYDFKYSLGFADAKKLDVDVSDLIFNLFNLPFFVASKIDGKLPYQPILFGWEDSDVEPIYEELFKRQTDQINAAIDTLVSTSEERLTDSVLQFVSDALAMLSVCTAFLPGAGAISAGLSMLFGMGSSAADFMRGELEDDAELAAQHKANALRGAIFDLAGPFTSKWIGKALPKSVYKEVSNEVVKQIISSGRVPNDVAKYLPVIRPRKSVLETANKIRRCPTPTVRGDAVVNSKVSQKFVNNRTVNKFNRLGRGPEVAQNLMDKTGLTYFAGNAQGYVYKGVVMRGDTRLPADIFENGFKLRKPYSDIRQINGMQGGFGGGKDALDIDGMGISTSAFYKDSGAGAYYYGGGKGGHTYVIDGRDMEGFHLYQNHQFANYPNSNLGKKPYEINYPNDIPPEKIVGAYDGNGVFTPNPKAIRRSIELSTPAQGRTAPIPRQKPSHNGTDFSSATAASSANNLKGDSVNQ